MQERDTNMFIAAEVIKKKRNGHALSDQEIDQLIQEFKSGKIPDYQMSAFAMAVYFRGMTETETLALTKAMLHSGTVISFGPSKKFRVDKHSTGGVGDKTSLILGPIVAAAGLDVPMISGRGLGHTGGTLDKLEAIPGFNINLSLDQFKKQILEQGICYIGQTAEICPADKKFYALRDVTATVESLPLICASIMSKKLAEGIDGLVLDVKFGSGAFMKSTTDAETLARQLMQIAKGYGKKVATILSSMNQPLGRFAGNALEVFECVEIMKNKTHIENGRDLYADTRELSVKLAGLMLFVGGKCSDLDQANALAEEILISGKAYEKFEELCRLQSGRIEELPVAKNTRKLLATKAGWVTGFNTEAIGIAGIALKAGRQISSDLIEPTAGIEFHKKMGDRVVAGDVLWTLHGADSTLFDSAEKILEEAITIGEDVVKDTLILKVLM